jgi:Skp family chaperone for outer membrane proteins
MILGTGMAALTIAIYLGSSLSAQTPTPAPTPAPAPTAAPAAPTTKIALINLNYVVKHYDKFTTFQAQMKTVLQKFQDEDKRLLTAMETETKKASNPQQPPDATQKAAIEENLKNLKRQREDNTANGKKELADKSDEGMKTLYIEVAFAAKRYAAARGIELVLHYNDATDQQEMWSVPNIARKIQAGACIPLDYAPGMDISPQIVQMLNAAYQSGAQTPAAGTPAAPAGATPTSAPAPAH